MGVKQGIRARPAAWLLGASLLGVSLLTTGFAHAQSRSWSGYYGGFHLGYGSGNSAVTTSTSFTPTGYFAATSVPAVNGSGIGSISVNQVGAGLTLGHDWQFGQTVVGIATDLDYMPLRGDRSSGAVYPCCGPTTFTIRQSFNTDYLVTLRGRAGYAWDRSLVYLTGGAAFTNLKFQQDFNDNFANAQESARQTRTMSGWLLGLGYEYALAERWSVKAEFQHTHFENMTGSGGTITGFSPRIAFNNPFQQSANLRVNVVRIGFNYRF